MSKYHLKGSARSDIAEIRRYTIKNWGQDHWLKYKEALFNKLQNLAEHPDIGINLEDVSENAFRFPLKEHVVYYLKRKDDVVFVGIIPNKLAPEVHLQRKLDLNKE